MGREERTRGGEERKETAEEGDEGFKFGRKTMETRGDTHPGMCLGVRKERGLKFPDLTM